MDFNNIIPLEDGSELQRQQQLHEQNQQLKHENTRLEALAARQLKTIENCQESIEREQNIYIAKMKEYDLLRNENTRLEALVTTQQATIIGLQKRVIAENKRKENNGLATVVSTQQATIRCLHEIVAGDSRRKENTRLTTVVATQGEIARWMEQVEHTCQQNEIAMDANMVLVMCNKGTIVEAEETKASIITRNQNLLTRTNIDLLQVLFWMKNEIGRLDDER